MLLSLVDIFRCPRDHEETALVLSVDAWNGPRVERGLLGCPTCQARYPIENGVVHFAPKARNVNDALAGAAPDEADRVRALLNLVDPHGVILLAGEYTRVAESMADEADVTCLVADGKAHDGQCVGLSLGDRIPLASGSLRAVATGASQQAPEFLTELARVTGPGGRILASSTAPVPFGVTILARDDSAWVAEVVPQPTVVSLRLERRTPR